MKMAFVLMALLSVALVGCGKDRSRSGGGVFTSNSSAPANVDGLILIPTYGGSSVQFQSGSNTYQLSFSQQYYSAYQVVQQMYYNQGYSPIRQDAQYRYYRARVTASCGNSYYSNYNYNQTYNTACTNGSVVTAISIQPY